MTELYALDIYRTETLDICGVSFRVSFAKRKDEDEYRLTAVHEASGETLSGSFSRDTAEAFKGQSGKELEDEVYEVLEKEIENNPECKSMLQRLKAIDRQA